MIGDKESFIDLIYCPEMSGLKRDIYSLSRLYEDRNKIYPLVNDLFKRNFTEQQIKGKNILLKPNWVHHSKSENDHYCLITNHMFTLSVLESVLQYLPGRVTIGDAPIQGCIWNKMMDTRFMETIEEFRRFYKTEINIKDFRRKIWEKSIGKVITDNNPLSEYSIFDLGESSFLDPISNNEGNFRVTNYDYRILQGTHRKGLHKYCIANDVLTADIIINLPKVKTHQKTGLTCALKNLVGINGEKDYLPHHRAGGTKDGGDCYPGRNYLREISQAVFDIANKNIGKKSYLFWKYLGQSFWKINGKSPYKQLAAGWYGNDTSWRMVMDLNYIAQFGIVNGSVSEKPVRTIFNFIDGIIGGEGNGPLKPMPFPLGFIGFSNNSALTDMVFALLMSFDPKKIPLIDAACKKFLGVNFKIFINAGECSISDLLSYSIKAEPSPGWKNFIENTADIITV
ncbi:MAG: DUF362 domain-containing protein [Ignavibacteriaceae bacterium]|nr:DUF362 domain-containing protein [Ignavibacteriaceae bacterium]